MTWHTWELACTLCEWMVCDQIQTRCTISTDERNSTEANLQIKCSSLTYSSKTNWKLQRNSKQDYPIQIRLSRIHKIQIYRKAEHTPDLNPNPCLSLGVDSGSAATSNAHLCFIAKFSANETRVEIRKLVKSFARRCQWHRRSQGGQRGHGHPQLFRMSKVILCFERRYPIRNRVASLKSRILAPQKFSTGYATGQWTYGNLASRDAGMIKLDWVPPASKCEI